MHVRVSCLGFSLAFVSLFFHFVFELFLVRSLAPPCETNPVCLIFYFLFAAANVGNLFLNLAVTAVLISKAFGGGPCSAARECHS